MCAKNKFVIAFYDVFWLMTWILKQLLAKKSSIKFFYIPFSPRLVIEIRAVKIDKIFIKKYFSREVLLLVVYWWAPCTRKRCGEWVESHAQSIHPMENVRKRWIDSSKYCGSLSLAFECVYAFENFMVENFSLKTFFMTTQQHQQNDGYVAWLRACSNWVVFQKWREIHHRIDWNKYSSHFVCTHRFFAIIRWLAIEIIVEDLKFLFNLLKLFSH